MGFAGQHEFKTRKAGNVRKLMLGLREPCVAMHVGDALTRWRWPGALELQGPGPNAPQALSSRRSRGSGWGAWNLGSLSS